MKPKTRVYLLDDQGQKIFGEGPYRLLKGVEACGSLRSAAISMGMAYTKALRLLQQAERALGYPLTRRSIGGRDGGGSSLTPQGKELMDRYESYREACEQANHRIYCQIFRDQC